jgi:YHS domain-containing protein
MVRRRAMGSGTGVSIDPVCGRPVVESASESVDYKRRKYFFCSTRCRKGFEHQSERMHVSELARAGNLFGQRRVRWGVA